eukprot:TRINITY_DN4286_c0_g1_i1.p1 TRINITY_DN4286_c0_g1~~TRINITY_DN4286_c0_g1_i1.p1  ORF type:complete len:349 (+),score=150.16 TRINITY_DN4286_c0_g1_i1:72-1118(+)
MSTWPTANFFLDSEGRRIINRNSDGDVVSVGALMNFQAPSVESSLLRNGKVSTKRAAHGGDMELHGTVWDPTGVHVANARLLRQPASLNREGFELRSHDTGDIDFSLEKDIVKRYYPSVCELVRQATGAARVVAFDHNIRSASEKAADAKIQGGNAKQSPAHLVHTDYTLTSGPQRLRDLAQPAKVNDTWRSLVPEGSPLISEEEVARVTEGGGHFAVINVWRNVKEEPVRKFPLAVCESGVTDPEDLITFEIHYEDRVGENYFAKYNNKQRWFYYPAMRKQEALVFKQWDSLGPYTKTGVEGASESSVPTFCLHTAFNDPTTTPESPDRESIEVRCIALFEADPAKL